MCDVICVHDWQLRTLTDWVQVQADKWVGSHPDKYSWLCSRCGASWVGPPESLPAQTEYRLETPAEALAGTAGA